MNCGNNTGILNKLFVYEDYRGAPHHLGQKLCATLIAFAQSHGFEKIVLNTPKNTDRAHYFYDKAGFQKIRKDDLQMEYDYPYEDSDFFLLTLF